MQKLTSTCERREGVHPAVTQRTEKVTVSRGENRWCQSKRSQDCHKVNLYVGPQQLIPESFRQCLSGDENRQ